MRLRSAVSTRALSGFPRSSSSLGDCRCSMNPPHALQRTFMAVGQGSVASIGPPEEDSRRVSFRLRMAFDQSDDARRSGVSGTEIQRRVSVAASTLARPMLPSVPHHRRKNGDVSTGRCDMQFSDARVRSTSGSFVVAFVRTIRIITLSISMLMMPRLALAQAPWERAANNLATTFTGPLARSLALVAIVIGGLMFMFGEQGAKRQISGIVFGGGLALFAAQFLLWLF